MYTLWIALGFIRWPLTFSLLAVLVLSVWSVTKLFGWRASADLRTKAWLDAILFWGAFASISGVLGTVVGFTLAAQSVEAAGEVTTGLLWGGLKVAMLSSAWGLLILALAALAWFVLQMRWRLLVAEQVGD